ncbi:MAG: hypothetical protein ACLURP_09665 [Ruminococcus sp.]
MRENLTYGLMRGKRAKALRPTLQGGRMAETYQIEMNLEQLERLLKNLPEGIMLEICFGKEEHGEDT